MNIFKRLAFRVKYNPASYFIVVPFGDPVTNVVKFQNYHEAEDFCDEELRKKPQFGRPYVLVILDPQGKHLRY